MASEVSTKIAKFAHDYRSRLLQEQGKTAAKMTKYDVAMFMKKEGALSESEFNSWVKEREGQDALQLTTQQQNALKRGSIMSFVTGMQSYLDSDEVSDFTLGNVLGFESTTNEKTGKTEVKSKAISKKNFSVAEEMKKQSFMEYIKSLPTPEATYTELMQSIEFNKLDNKGKMEMMLKISGEKFNKAKEKGDKQAMKDYLLEGIGMALQLSCQKIDSTIGITQFKEWAKERSGLNFLVDLVDKYVDDGDDATLSWLEKNWEGVKGFGDALDSFIGTQAVAFIGALELAGAAAGTGAIGQVFNAATKAYFLYDGGKMMVNGAVGYYNAETKQDARLAGTEFGMGTVIFTGTLKSVIGEIQAYRASHAVPEGQGGLPELSEAHQTMLAKQNYSAEENALVSTDLAFLQKNGIEIVEFSPGHGIAKTESSFIIKYNGKTINVTNDVYGPSDFKTAVSQLAQHIKGEAPKVWTDVETTVKPSAPDIIAAAEAKISTTEVSDAGGLTEFTLCKDAQGNTVKTTVKQGFIEKNTYTDGKNTVDQTIIDGKEIGKYIHDGKTGTYVDAKGNVVTEEAFSEALTKATTEAYNKQIASQYREMTSDQLRNISQTPEGVQALADAKVVVTKGNATDFSAKVHEGQSSSPARQMRKLDLSGTPEEACARNTDVGLKYNADRQTFYIEVSWDGGKTIETMDIPNDPLGNFVVNYGTEPWNHAHIGGTEAKASYVEPKAYNADGTKIPVDPESVGTEWFDASKAAPVRFMKVPEGVKGIVGKEGFQPITSPTQVVAFDVKGQPYINEARYFLENSKGLTTETIETLYEIDPSLKPVIKTVTEGNKTSVYKNGVLKSTTVTWTEQVDTNPWYANHPADRGYIPTQRENVVEYHNNGQIKRESYKSGYAVREFDENGNLTYLKEGSSPALRFDENHNPIKPYPNFDVKGYIDRLEYLSKIFKEEGGQNVTLPAKPLVQSNPATYRERLQTPDYSHTRENFPADAHQSQSASGSATAYTTDGKPDGIVYRDSADGKLKVPNKWDPEHPYEVSDGSNGEPASVIMIYDETGGDFAVGDPTTIASTYKNPATGQLDPLYDVPAGRENAFGIEKDVIPSAYKLVEPGTEIQTKEGPRVVQENEVVVYDTDGDPYVMPLKNFLKRQKPVGEDSQAIYQKLQAAQKDGTRVPADLMVKEGNATSPNAKTYKAPVNRLKKYVKPEMTEVGVKPEGDVMTAAPVQRKVTNVTGQVEIGEGSLSVTRPNGTKVDLFEGIPQEILDAPARDFMRFPDATTVPENFGVTLTQHASSPIEAQYIPTGKTVAETLRLANESGVPLKFDPEAKAFYQDAPYGGRQYVNTESITPVYTHEAEPNWGLAENYAAEYGHEVQTPDGVKTYAVDRAVVTANPNPTDNGLSANCAGKQYDIVHPDGTRTPYSPDQVKPGETFQISKREGVQLKMAVFDKPTTSPEGETLPAGKLLMIDADGHPYDGNPIKRIKSGEVSFEFDTTDPKQAQIKADIDEAVRLEKEAKAAGKAGNKDLKNQLNAQAKDLTNKAQTELTEWVKENQSPKEPTAKKPYVKPEMTEVNVKPEGDVMASPTVSSNEFLSGSNRVLHPKNYARAQELKAKGMEVEFDPKTKTAKVSIDISDIENSEVLNHIEGRNITQTAGTYNGYNIDTTETYDIYKFKGVKDGKAVFEIKASNVTDALQGAIDNANGNLVVRDSHGKTEPRDTFKQTLKRLISNEKYNFEYNMQAKVPEGLKDDVLSIARTKTPGSIYLYKDVRLSDSQMVKVELLAKHGVELELQMGDNQGHNFTTEIRFVQNGTRTVIKQHSEAHSYGMDDRFDAVLDAKLKEVAYEADKAKATQADAEAADRAAEYEAKQAKMAKAKARAAEAKDFASPRLEKAKASGVKDSKPEQYKYYVAKGRDEGYYSTGTKMVTTYNDGTVTTDYSSHQKVTKFPDGSFILEEPFEKEFTVTYDPNGKLSITDGSDSYLGFDYNIDVDAKLLKDIGYNPADFNVEVNAYDHIAKMYNQASKAIVQNAKTELNNIAARLESDPVFANETEFKQFVTEMLEKLPKTEDMVNRNISANYYQKAIKELQDNMAEVTKYAAKVERNNTSNSAYKIIQELKVPFEELRAADRQIISEIGSLEKMMIDNHKVFENRVGFKNDYTNLKNTVVQELNTKGSAQAIESAVKARINQLRSDFQKMIDALGDK